MQIDTLTIVGVGLIGGSIALAARRRHVAARVIGTGTDVEGLEQALAVRAIDESQSEMVEAVCRADIAVFCTPVDRIADQVLAAAGACPPKTLLTDTGSTKSLIVERIERSLSGDRSFVGAHPLAGSEKRGVAHADADLFEGRITVLTKTAHTKPEALTRAAHFWEALGARTRVMHPVEHDQALALTSHLPHLVAAALAGILPPELRELTATGFRDTTRVASGDPSLWRAVFEQNKSSLLASLGQLEHRLEAFRKALTDGDAQSLDLLLAAGKEVRDALGS